MSDRKEVNIVEFNLIYIKKICKLHYVDKLFTFGSINTDKFNSKSDIDLLIKFASIDLYDYFENYMSLKNKLEKKFNRKVDLIEEQTLKNPYLINSININKKLIWTSE